MEVLAQIVSQAPVYIASVVAILSALVGLFLLIPGDQPEKFLRGAVEILSKFSKK